MAGNMFLYCLRLLAPGGLAVAWLFLFTDFVIYTLLQFFFVWYLYCRFQKPKVPKDFSGLSVDVFVTAYNEPKGLVKRTLGAAKKITYPHRTYLLDDSAGCLYSDLAEQAGSEYLTREGNQDHKAGNINAALAKTAGDFVAIFDTDHAPRPEFLDRTLGFFENEQIGFVQAMETFGNADENLIAQASTQTALGGKYGTYISL